MNSGRQMRIRIAFSAAVAVLIAAVLATSVVRPRPALDLRFGEASYEQIREGISEAEVVAILGPPGLYRPTDSTMLATSWPVRADHWGPMPSDPRYFKLRYEHWAGNSYDLGVTFDEDGFVVGRGLQRVVPRPPSYFEKLLLRLGL